MGDDARPPIPWRGSERETLVGMLDFLRDAVVRKVGDLDRAAATTALVPSGTTLLGIVKHLAHVERWWFRAVFAGEAVTFPWSEEDPDAEFRIEEGEEVGDLVALYRREAATANAIVAAAADLDVLAENSGERRVSLRWILVHMIEETGRHAGHADILRELTDGTTGE